MRLRGEFEHIEQGEFLLYSSDEALDRIDTLRIADGVFTYTLPAAQPATLHILYPNLSELVVFATPGADITIRGDAQNLSEVEVTGNEENETYTHFRKETLGKSDEEQRAVAHDFILQHPTLAMSRHLLATYFLNDPKAASPGQVTELYDSLCRACPDDLALSKLAQHVRAYGTIRPGVPLPDFALALPPGHGGNGSEPRTIKRDDYKGKTLLIAFWASWKGGSQSALFRSRRLRRELRAQGKDICLVSYSLDADERRLAAIEERDSIDYPIFCDQLCMSSPLVVQWGIRELPYYVLVAPDGKILAAGSDWLKDIEKTASKL